MFFSSPRACDAAYELPAMRVERDGVWLTWTYGRYYHDIKAAAKAFIKFGKNSIGIL